MLNIKDFLKNMKKKKELDEVMKSIGMDKNSIATINTEEDFYEYIDKIKNGKIKPFSILINISSEEGRKLLNNKEIVLEAVKYFGEDLSFACDELKANPTIIEAAATTTPRAIAYAINPSIDILKRIAIKSLENFIAITIYYPKEVIEIQKDYKLRTIFLEYIRKRPDLIKFFNNYHNDIEFLKYSLEYNPYYIKFAGKDISNSIIIKELKQIKTNFLKEIKKCINDNYNIEEIKNKYDEFVTYITNIVLNIKKTSPERFESSKFIYEIAQIEPKLIKTAGQKALEDENLKKQFDKCIKQLPKEINDIISNKL